MYWRRFPVSEIPLEDSKAFDKWINDRWLEKDQLLKQFSETGRFPADTTHASDGEPKEKEGKALVGAGYIETSVKLNAWYDILQIFVMLASFAMMANIGAKLWNLVIHGSLQGLG